MSKRNWVWCWACMFLVVFASQALAQELPDPTNPAEISWTYNTTPPAPGTFGTYFDLGFTAGIPGVPGEYDVSITDADGNPVFYPGWCITNVWGIDVETPVNLYSTRFSYALPSGLQTYQVETYDTDAAGIPTGSPAVHSVGDRVPWNELNWLLNNRGSHSIAEMMYAIHRLMYGEDAAWSDGKGLEDEGKGLDLYMAALSHPYFIPGPGQVVAVVLYRENDTVPPFSQILGKQDVIIELPVPKPIRLKCASCFADAAKVGVPYSETMKVTGGVAPYTFSIVGGSLPDGLELNSDTGEITGTPTKAGFYAVKIKVEDVQGNSDTAICLIIVRKPYIRLDCGDCYSKTGYVGAAFSHQLYVAGGVAPFTFSVVSGSLPPGLTLNPSTGIISGTPNAAGTYNYTVKVVDANGNSDTDACSIVIKCASIKLSCSSCGSTAKVGEYYFQQLKVSGGTAPFTFSIISGSLPPGLHLNSSSGKISGKPTSTGTYGFKAKVVDSKGSSATVWCTIEVRRCR